MRALSNREGKLVAVGLLIAALALVWLAIVNPVIGGFAARAEERQILLASYARNQRLLAGLPVWRAQAAEQRASAGRFAILAASQSQATETLRQRIARTIAAQGATVSAIQDIQADPKAGKVRVRADLKLTLAQLHESLKRLQEEEPYVVVEYVSVVADRAAETGRLSPMDVRIEVSCDWRPGPGGTR